MIYGYIIQMFRICIELEISKKKKIFSKILNPIKFSSHEMKRREGVTEVKLKEREEPLQL